MGTKKVKICDLSNSIIDEDKHAWEITIKTKHYNETSKIDICQTELEKIGLLPLHASSNDREVLEY